MVRSWVELLIISHDTVELVRYTLLHTNKRFAAETNPIFRLSGRARPVAVAKSENSLRARSQLPMRARFAKSDMPNSIEFLFEFLSASASLPSTEFPSTIERFTKWTT